MAKHSDSAGPQGSCFWRCPHREAPPRSTNSIHSGPRPQGQNSAPTSGPQASHVARGSGRAIVYMQCLEQHIRSPFHCRKVRKSWEDPTTSNVTCQDPTWTSFLSINSNFAASQKSRQILEEALCGLAEGGYLLNSSNLYFSIVFLGGKKCWRCPPCVTKPPRQS